MKKRVDPRMHSAEHILNRTMDRMFHCGRCFSAHIEKKKSKCDYHFDRPLQEEEIHRIQAQVNRIIQADMPVAEKWIPRREAEEDFNLERLPQNADEMIRIIEIGDYDACPCIGPHIGTTGEIGHFRITTTSFENGVLRIRYRLSKEL